MYISVGLSRQSVNKWRSSSEETGSETGEEEGEEFPPLFRWDRPRRGRYWIHCTTSDTSKTNRKALKKKGYFPKTRK